MKKLSNYEKRNIKAGAKTGFIVAAVASAVTFLIGIFDGFTRPFKCR